MAKRKQIAVMEFDRTDQIVEKFGLMVWYQELKDWWNIRADREGVIIIGSVPQLNASNRANFEAVLDRAFEQHYAICTKNLALGFDGDPDCVIAHYQWDADMRLPIDERKKELGRRK